jgi:hypothetical protein
MIAQRDAERESREETDEVRDVGNVRVVAGYPALLVDHDDAANEMDYCNKSARRRRVSLGIEFEPILPRFLLHDAPCWRSEFGLNVNRHPGNPNVGPV